MNKHFQFLLRRSVLLLAVFLMTAFPSASVYAQQRRLSDDPNFLMSNGIYFYSPTSRSCVAPGQNYTTSMSLPSLKGNSNAEKIWNFFTGDAGLSPEQAAGLMGNIRQESNYEPDAVEGNGVGYGIVQWSFGRRTALEDAAKKQGVDASNLEFQLAFLVQESKDHTVDDFVMSREYYRDSFGKSGDNEWETIKKQKTVEDAMLFFHASFEKSADTYDQIKAGRLQYADQAFASFSAGKTAGQSVSSSGSSSSNSDCAPFAGGDLTQTLLAYAHPEFHENNWDGPVPPPKQAYLDVATKLTKEGKWVGGGMQEIGIPGIDCGGFVSILLTQSGFEPDYNFGLDMDRGSSNQEYGQLPWAKRNWSFLGTGGNINTSDLRPGDVAYSNGHTFVFVGEIEGFSSQYASASYSWWRAPMAAGSWDGGFESATNPDYVWYGRREGTPPAYGSTHINDPVRPENGTPYVGDR